MTDWRVPFAAFLVEQRAVARPRPRPGFDRFLAASSDREDPRAPHNVQRFLSHLAVAQDVSALTQNQAFSALLFLHSHALEEDLGGLANIVWAREKRRLPVILSPGEVHPVLARPSARCC